NTSSPISTPAVELVTPKTRASGRYAGANANLKRSALVTSRILGSGRRSARCPGRLAIPQNQEYLRPGRARSRVVRALAPPAPGAGGARARRPERPPAARPVRRARPCRRRAAADPGRVRRELQLRH